MTAQHRGVGEGPQESPQGPPGQHAAHGGEPEPVDCADVLSSLYLFLDHEIDEASSGEIKHHLEACAPCLSEYELELMVKALVARSCAERAPEPLRDRVLLSIRQVHIEISELSRTQRPWL